MWNGDGGASGVRRPAVLLSLVVAFIGLGAAQAQAGSWQALVANDLSTSDSVSQIDTATNLAQSPVAVGELPLGIAIAPDARTAYVVDVGIRSAHAD